MTNGLFYMSSTLCYISTRTLKRYSLDYANSVFPFLSSSTNSLSTVFISSTSFFFKFLFYLFLAALGLHCCMRVSLVQWVGDTLAWDAQASYRDGFSWCRAQALGTQASVVLAHSLSCSTACGLFLEQGSNPCSLRSHADSHPLHHLGSPRPHTFLIS